MSRNGGGFWGETWQTARAVGSAMAITLKNLFRKPVTVHYPDVVRPYPDRLRGILALAYDPETGRRPASAAGSASTSARPRSSRWRC